MHVLLIAVASLTVLNVSITRVPEASGAMRGELEPVDNRAEKGKVVGSGGGSPGEIGGLGSIAFVVPAAGTNPQGPGLDPAADALLNEILPSTAQQPAEALQRALPGPQTTGVGLIPGSGLGGGGGSGEARAAGSAAASAPGPSSSAPASTVIRSLTSSTAPAVWACGTRWRWPSVSSWPA